MLVVLDSYKTGSAEIVAEPLKSELQWRMKLLKSIHLVTWHWIRKSGVRFLIQALKPVFMLN